MRCFAGGLTGDGGRVVDKDGNATAACALEGAAEPDDATPMRPQKTEEKNVPFQYKEKLSPV